MLGGGGLHRLYADIRIDPHSPATIFFTSGTSGDSKAVLLSHAGIAAVINSNRDKYQAPERTLSILPYHHAFGLVVGVFMVFNEERSIFINTQVRDLLKDFQDCSPMAVAVVPIHLEFIHKRIRSTIKSKKLKVMFKLAVRIGRLLRAIGIDIRRKLFASILKTLGGSITDFISGGAALNPDIVQFFDDIGIIVINGYGLTECSPVISTEKLNDRKTGSCGKPLNCCTVRIAEDGEILVKGENLFLGYYKDEKQTREVLINGEFATGDIGHLDEEGYLFITGRKKNLIVLSNGENISPEAIEMPLLQDEGVEEVVVVEHEGRIVALVYPAEQYRGNEEYFRQLRDNYNMQAPSMRQIADIRLRETAFEKNSSRKILRHRIEV
ncbi:MAG TPA: long-chain fatty acid--CoA ligase [Clostridiaceae bacterium]|nr:long-chain fatty acid--CoA ligase [Clostridiaceae bacterium]